MIIGVGYRARAGKDAIADHLVEHHGFIRAAFADALKQACAEIFGLNKAQLYGKMKEEVDPFWNDTPRNILQKVGTECLRRGYRDDVWVKALERRVVDHPTAYRVNWIISDVRFPNEANAVKRWGGVVWRVDRPDLPQIATSGHASETSMQDFKGWDHVILNDGTITDLHLRVEAALDSVRRR